MSIKNITYDVSMLMQYVSEAKNAQSAIEKANRTVKSITSHSDWNCAERDRINQMLEAVRQNIDNLNNCVTSLTHAIETASSQFESMENSVINLFGAVDNLISNVISIPTNPVQVVLPNWQFKIKEILKSTVTPPKTVRLTDLKFDVKLTDLLT